MSNSSTVKPPRTAANASLVGTKTVKSPDSSNVEVNPVISNASFNELNSGVTSIIFAIEVDGKFLFSSSPQENARKEITTKVKFLNKFFILIFFKVYPKV